MKLSVLIFAATDEQKYVKRESRKPHGPYLANAYADVDEEEEEYGDRTDYRWGTLSVLYYREWPTSSKLETN